MKYRPFHKYSDMTFDQEAFYEASGLDKLKVKAASAYNKTLDAAPLAGVAAGVAAGVVVAQGMNMDATMGAVGGAPGGVVGNMIKERAGLQETEARLADNINEYGDRFLRASIVEARAERAMNNSDKPVDEKYQEFTKDSDLNEMLQRDEKGIRTIVEEYAGEVGIILNEGGMGEDSAKQVAEKSAELYNKIKEVGGKKVDRDEIDHMYKFAQLNAQDYYAQMQVGEKMLNAEEKGTQLSAEQMNDIGREAVRGFDKFMDKQVEPLKANAFRNQREAKSRDDGGADLELLTNDHSMDRDFD